MNEAERSLVGRAGGATYAERDEVLAGGGAMTPTRAPTALAGGRLRQVREHGFGLLPFAGRIERIEMTRAGKTSMNRFATGAC